MAEKEFVKERTEPSYIGNETRKVFSHPAFGMMRIARVQTSKGMEFFGSGLRHTTFVKIEFTPGEMIREGNITRYSSVGQRPVFQVEMSEASLAAALTSMNIGEGTPVNFSLMVREKADGTLVRKEVPEVKGLADLNETFAQEIKDKSAKHVEQCMVILSQLKTLRESGKANKGQLQALENEMSRAFTHFSSNMAFLEELFREAMSATMDQAKAELQGHYMGLVHSLGVQALALQDNDIASTMLQIGDSSETG